MKRSNEIAAPQFVGGATLEKAPLRLSPGWRFAEDGSPGPDFHVVRCVAFRTRPDGEYRKLLKWKLRPSLQNKMRERIERLRLEILREDSESIARAVARTDRELLRRKNAANGVRPLRKRARR
jgi:hypothetical protein